MMISFNFPWGFLFMECVTLTHKYLMHGFMWYFHEDHHQPKYIFERNDIFFCDFAIPSMFLFLLEQRLVLTTCSL
jgi:beta-carotene 3-hydroxylase